MRSLFLKRINPACFDISESPILLKIFERHINAGNDENVLVTLSVTSVSGISKC
jgi:hypothetical protein